VASDAGEVLLLAHGARACEELLASRYAIHVEKVINPLTVRGLRLIEGRLSAALQQTTRGNELKAVARALNMVDVDWANISEAARKRVQDSVRKVLGEVVPANVAATQQMLRVTAKSLFPSTRQATIQKFKLRGVGSSLTQRDKKTSSALQANTSLFVRDAYGRIHDGFSNKARNLVAAGLKQGLGSAEISEKLAAALSGAVQRAGYWDLIASTFANRARTYTQLHAYEEAGIRAYRFEAVLDEVTSEICRFLHGQEFPVKGNVERIARVSAGSPEDLLTEQPWLSQGKNDDGEDAIFVGSVSRGNRQQVATIASGAMGVRDGIGTYTDAMDAAALDALGANMPPVHGNCRSTVVPVERR
jgi:SPP1 gp7 family putative phage head morphogenesis protein